MLFKIIYVIYLIVSLFFASFEITSSISLRHIMTVVMFLLCIYERGVKFDKFLKWYILFLVFYGLSCILTGFEMVFFRNLIGTFFAAIVIYMATTIMIRKYNWGNVIITTILALAVINSFVAIGQFYGNQYAIGLTTLFQFNLTDELVDLYESQRDFHGRYVGGLLDIVLNGYFLSAASVLALYNKKGKITILNWIVFAIIFYALFLCQERSGLCYVLLFISFYQRTKIKVLF